MSTTKNQKKIVSYFMLAALGVVLMVNTFLTIWIITATGLGYGLNSMRLWDQHVETSGTLLAMKSLVTNQIRNTNDLSLVSAGNITLIADNSGRKPSMIKMDQSSLKMAADKFHLIDSKGRNILESGHGTTVVSSPNIQINSEGGQSFRSGVETQAITAGPGNSLHISSPVGSLDMMGPQSVNLASFAGPIHVEAFGSVFIRSKGRGSIELSAGSIRMPGIANRTSYPMKRRTSVAAKQYKTYQLCSCQDGRLFMVSPTSSCVADYHICASS